MNEGLPANARLRPELLEDVGEAFAWYESKAEGVGHDFVRAFFAAVARATRNPTLARVVHDGFRRVRLRRFPHSLYYREEDGRVVFFLLFHAARHPGRLRSALQERATPSDPPP